MGGHDGQRVVAVTEPYAVRAVSALGLWRSGEWRIKRYAIAYRGTAARPALLAAAERTAARVLPTPALTSTRYGVGFLGVHDGRGANFVFVDWWEEENELHHHVFLSPSDAPGALRRATSADPVACVWDLAVLAHEREAWIRHVLAAEAAGLEAYLEDHLAGPV
jgi:hypothetical protein